MKLVQLALVGVVGFIGSAQAAENRRIKCEMPFATRTTQVSFVIQATSPGMPFGAGGGVAHVRVNYLGKVTNRRIAVKSYYHKAYPINVFQADTFEQEGTFYFRSNEAHRGQAPGELFNGKFGFGSTAGTVRCRFLN